MSKLSALTEKYRQLILDAEKYIWQHPETGYREEKTSAYMAEEFKKLGYEVTKAEGITGFYTVIDTGREGPEVLVLAELDSVICPSHPDADPETGAVHSCGHHAQCAALLGVAAVLREPGALDDLCGRIRLCCVPAEELLEIEYRQTLKKKGVIKYLGGKSEFLSRGYFDGVDMAFMVHSSSSFCVMGGSVGCMAKTITYKGKASHAGGSPWSGKNALYAAMCGLNAVNAIRETFRDSDIIRVHPIMTAGGEMVNAIPDKACLESYVRGKTFDAIASANKKVNRALCSGALALGTNIEIVDIPGYSPLVNDKNLSQIAKEAAEIAIPGVVFNIWQSYSSGSTDMGDLSAVMPVVHPYGGGSQGNAHGNDYYIVDKETACVGSAKMQLEMLYLLLCNGAERGKKVVSEYKAPFASKEDYLSYVDSLNCEGDRITYNDDGTASLKID